MLSGNFALVCHRVSATFRSIFYATKYSLDRLARWRSLTFALPTLPTHSPPGGLELHYRVRLLL